MALTTLANVKAYIGSPDADDSLIGDLITRAQAMIETFCGRAFDEAEFTEYKDGNNQRTITLKNTPVSAVASVGYRTGPAAWTDFPTTAYDWSAEGIVELLHGSFSGTFYALGMDSQRLFGQGLKSVEVVYTGGYGAGEIPADLEQGCIELVAALWGGDSEARTASARGIKAESIGYMSWTYMTPQERTEFMEYRFGAYRRPFV